MKKAATFNAGALTAAHHGYAYQDLLTAYLLVRGLVTGFDEIVIDRKVVNDDRFDDVETRIYGRRLRRQIKSSQKSDRTITFDDFNNVRSSLRFDRLVRTFVGENTDEAEEYRLCTTWSAPESSDELSTLLVPLDVPGTLDGHVTSLMRLDAAKLWPANGSLAFPVARQALADAGDFGRDDVLRFCQRFVIEVGLPHASLDLELPGPLERLVISVLKDGIGIGRYPNDVRRVEDVAALAIHVAMTARAAGESLSKADLTRRLDIQTDFGRVAQAFPLERGVMQQRASVRKNLMNAVRAGGIHFVLAGPGSGKSWVLTQLAEDMDAVGIVVARHYCFLEPGDELVERRVMTDVFIGNLMGELTDALKRHQIDYGETYAASLDELEKLLEYAAQDGREVVVIVDGLDHIARVRAGTQSLSDSETDIAERLATLTLPDNVSLVIGSQPGQHLDSIRAARKQPVAEHSLSAWSRQEVEGLALALGVAAALDDIGLNDGEEQRPVFDALAERSEGNPLYTRYLCRALVDGLHAGHIVSPGDWLGSAPAIEGDISRYYMHLYDSASKEAQAIADVLGVLDFSVTVDEIKEIVGELLEDRVADALATLSPVLSHASAQGGLRVFHESFRRFMIGGIQQRGASLAKILKPVGRWLESKEFFVNAKSFRFLFPVMRRSDRELDILERVGTDFVKRSVEFGHPEDAIERNLTLAADVAARNLDWVALMRIAELSRALAACFDEGNNNWHEYWQTFLSTFGPQTTSERLLFDGRPTLDRTEGLLVCAAVDEAGISAPWREYLALPVSGVENLHSRFDPFGAVLRDEEGYLAAIYGRLRLGQHYRVVRLLLMNLSNPDEQVTSAFIRKVARMLAEQGLGQIVRQLVRRASTSYCGRFPIPHPVACALLLGLADDVTIAPEICGPQLRYATEAMAFTTALDEVLWCLERGASIREAPVALVNNYDLEVFRSKAAEHPNISSMRDWVASVRLSARTEQGRVNVNDALRMAHGEGWYLCWVRFVLRLAIVEGLSAEGADFDIVGAFQELTADTRPFVGKPRACDLYSIWGLINESLARGLAHIQSVEDWEQVVASVFEARSGTATNADREDGGPITAGAFITLLLPYAKKPFVRDFITVALEKQLADEEESGTYYSTHAEFRMRLARWYADVGKKLLVEEHWSKAAQFLVAYTFHKDIALFDLLDSVASLKNGSNEAALTGLVRLQPLLGAVIRHTDHRETRNAPNAWFRALLEVDAIRAAFVLGNTFVADVGSPSWIGLSSLRDLLNKVSDTADPLVVDALWETLLFEIEYESDGLKMLSERLVPLERLAQSDSTHLAERFTCLARQAQNEPRSYSHVTVAPLHAFAEEHRLPFQVSRPGGVEPLATEGHSSSSNGETKPWQSARPAFPTEATMVDIVATARRIVKKEVSEEEMYGLLTLPLSYMLSEMVERGEEAQAQRIVYFLVHDAKGWNYATPHPICKLAECLDASGHNRLAAVAYVLNFAIAGGRWGWLNFGGHEFTPVLQRALELDSISALQALANETARILRLGGFNGVSRHLVQQIAHWGDAELAAAAWEEALRVMETRLPMGGNAGYFQRLNLSESVDWSLDEGLVALLLARACDPSVPRRTSALVGFVRLLSQRPHVLQRPVHWLLTGSTTVLSVQAVLQLLLESPENVADVVLFNEDVLRAYTKSKSWTLSTLAVALLSRVGVCVDGARTSSAKPGGATSRDSEILTRIGDRGELLPRLAQVWPNLPRIIVSEMHRISVNNRHFKELSRERFELENGRLNRSRPGAEILSWPSEVVAATLDDVLCGLPAYLSRTGQWNAGTENQLLWALLPDLETRLALHASLVPRPAIPFPTEADNSIRPIVRISEDDPQYSHWIRFATREVHFFHSDQRTWDKPNRRGEVFAGIVRTALDGTVPSGVQPFRPGGMWPWREPFDEDDAWEDALLPQLVKSFATKDWLGQCTALVPPLALRHQAKLRPPGFGGPLKWFDQNGKPAVVLRTWRVRGEGDDIESYSTQGCELLLRPDFEDALFETFGGPLKELRQVHVRDLSDDR